MEDDDQCDFDSLAALLDSPEKKENENHEMSDEELDRLVMLAEMDGENIVADETENKQNSTVGQLDEPTDQAVVTVLPVTSVDESNNMPVDLMAEFRKMQEKIQMLEAQLNEQKKQKNASNGSETDCSRKNTTDSGEINCSISSVKKKSVQPDTPKSTSCFSKADTEKRTPPRKMTSDRRSSSSQNRSNSESLTTSHKSSVNKSSQKVRSPDRSKVISPLTDKTSSAVNNSNSQHKSSSSHKSDRRSVPADSKVKVMDEDIFFGSSGEPQVSRAATKPDIERKRHNSDSDWEGLDGERDGSLNDHGLEIKKLLTSNPRERVAHAAASSIDRPTPAPTIVPKVAPKDAPKAKSFDAVSDARASTSYISSLVGVPSATSITTSYSADNCSKLQKKSDATDIYNEQYSGIRIIAPLVSSAQMKIMMENRRMIKLSTLKNKLKSQEIDGDWVTMAVVVSKTDQRQSAKGKNYSIWKLSDLVDCQQPISLFLFGDVNSEHWKKPTGSVIGILNPSIMQNADTYKSSSEISLTVDNPKKILPLGKSKDLGICHGKTKAGNSCTNFINTQGGDYCTYHLQSGYKKQSAKRAELQSGFSGMEPKFKKEMDKLRQPMYKHKNEWVTSGKLNKKLTNISVNSLVSHHLNSNDSRSQAKINTLLLHDIIPEDKEMLLAMKQKKIETDASTKQKKDEVDDNKTFLDLLTVPSAGAMNFVKHMKESEKIQQTKTSDKKGKPDVQVITASQLLKQYSLEKSSFNIKTSKKETVTSPQSLTSQLGRGLQGCASAMVDLDDIPFCLPKKSELAEKRAKVNALAKIEAIGGLKKEDPNCVRKKQSPAFKERIRKRLLEETEGKSSADSSEEQPPAEKKSKLIGNVDLNSTEVQKLMKAKSSHASLLTELEQERQEEYFDVMEKTEKMEDKMMNTMEMKVTAVTCSICKYTALGASQLCRDENHNLKRHSATKRFFRCKDCKRKCTSLNKLPTKECSQCGSSNWERVGMMTEKKGPKLPSEELQLRGEEIKFLNSY